MITASGTRYVNMLERFLNIRNRHFLTLDIILLALAPLAALALRLEGVRPMLPYATALILYLAVALAIRLGVFYRMGMYQRYWRYASIGEVAQITLAVAFSSLVVLVMYTSAYFAPDTSTWATMGDLPRSIPIIESLLVLILVGGNRFSLRALQRLHQRQRNGKSQRVAIMGAGDAGAMMVREMNANPHLGMHPVLFFDDDPNKQNMRIHGVPVMGGRERIPEDVDDYNIQQLIIAMPTASGKVIREVVRVAEQAGVATKTMPGMYELLGGKVSVNQLRDVEIEDLLRRDAVRIDTAAVTSLIRGKRVLVSGGGGSIGSELCRQVWRCQPAELVIIGHGENSLFDIYNELCNTQHATRILPVIADIRFADRLQSIFAKHRPQIVFHAAAHKHVPLMERNPGEAITNNVLGTRNVLRSAQRVGVEQLVMISTDKAVNPTSLMGASKRTAELLVMQAARRSGKPYVAVRFGNVLGSRGSALITFEHQIKAGGPVTVTHPDMKRYFMTIPEAVQLVLQASVLGQGGEVFMLDMGDPIKIADLARDLIELSGLELGEDIDIIYTGMRPGEKLFEEMFVEGEDYQRTRHEKIFIAANASSFVPDALDGAVEALAVAAHTDDRQTILTNLQALIPEFQPVGESVVGFGAQATPIPSPKTQAQQPPPPPSTKPVYQS